MSLRHVGRGVALGLAMGLLWASVPNVPAQAATTTFYLGSDGAPLASLTSSAPTADSLANYDPGRDDQPGLVLQPTLLAGLLETDPARYQTWSAQKGGLALDGAITFRFWSAAEGFAPDTRGTVRVGAYDCNQPETSCNLIASDTLSKDRWSSDGDWAQHTVHWPNVQYDVPNGHHLMVKIVVGTTSDTALMFAYDTADYPSRLESNVIPANQPPVPEDDIAGTNEDAAVTVDLLENDSDPEADVLGVVSVSAAGHGSVVNNGDGSATYQPDPDWHGVDTFIYTITDGASSAVGSVDITVAPVNDAPVAIDDSTSTAEDTTTAVDVLDNDVDVDGDHLTVSSIRQPASGMAGVTGEQTITFTPASDWSGIATIPYEVSDGNVTDTAVLVVRVDPVNDAPAVIDDLATVPEDGSVTFDVLSNDTDIDGDSLILRNVGSPMSGAVTLNGGGSVTYTPDPDFAGLDSFQYTAGDGIDTATALVTLEVAEVNDAPVASDFSFTLLEDTSISFDPVADAMDVDGDALALVTVDNPAGGTATIDAAGAIVVAFNGDWNGATEFQYQISDGNASATGEVRLIVEPVNDPPVAIADEATTVEDQGVLIDVTANDFDVDGDSLDLLSVLGSGSGVVEIEDGSIRYTPATDWWGTDLLTYVISDGTAPAVGVVRVTVTPVNDAPTAGQDAVTTTEDTTVNIAVLVNDTDPDGDDLVISAVGDAAFGTATAAAKDITYTPTADAFGIDTFTYVAHDPSGETTVGTVVVSVLAVNDLPQAMDDTVVTLEDAIVRMDVLANDIDIDGDVLSFEIAASPTHGALSVAGDGSVIYMPEADWHGVARFSYTIADGEGAARGAVTVTVIPVNDAPKATADHLEVDEDGSVSFDPTHNDSDVDGDTLAVAAWAQPRWGRVNAAADRLTYVPSPDYSGTDFFSYTVTDGQGGFAEAEVTVTVHSVADAVAVDEAAPTKPFGPEITIDISSGGFMPEFEELEIVAVSQGEHGVVTPNEDGTLSFVPTEHFAGSDSFRYIVTDGSVARSAEVTVAWELDGAALIEISMTPSSVSAAQWLPAAQPGAVAASEAADTVVRLAAPAAIAAAAAGATILSQSEAVVRVVARLGQIILSRV
jgi:hypothetical protein